MCIKVGIKQSVVIGESVIDEEVFDKEMVGYTLTDREEFVDDLIRWISEISPWNKDKAADKILMKQDLAYLMGLEDEYIFNSIHTNEYVAMSDRPDQFIKICEEIIEAQQELEEQRS